MNNEVQVLTIEGHTLGFDVVEDMLEIYRPDGETNVLLGKIFVGVIEPDEVNYFVPEETEGTQNGSAS